MLIFKLLAAIYQIFIGYYQWGLEILGPMGKFISNGGEYSAGTILGTAIFFSIAIGLGICLSVIPDFCKKRGYNFRISALLFSITYLISSVGFILIFPYLMALLFIGATLCIPYLILYGPCKLVVNLWKNPVVGATVK